MCQEKPSELPRETIEEIKAAEADVRNGLGDEIVFPQSVRGAANRIGWTEREVLEVVDKR